MLLLLPALASISFNIGATHRPSALPRVGPALRLSVTPATPLGEGEWEVIKEGGAFYGRASQSKLRVNVAGKEITFGTGLIARQANAAVTVEQGQTHVFSAACFERKTDFEAIDFTPLKVDYFERQSAAGRTLGGYIKRDGKPSNHETLTSRLIDRPIRPLIAKGWSLETQLTAYVLAYDGTHMPDVLAILASSAALALSEVPFPKPVAAVRVGLIEERRPERPAPPAAPDDAVSDGAASDDAAGAAGAGAAEEDDFLDELILDEQVISDEASSGSAQDGAQTKSYRLVINPTREEMAISKLNLVIAGTSDAVLMVEGFCDFLPEETVLEAMELGLKSVRTLALPIGALMAAACGSPSMQVLTLAPPLFHTGTYPRFGHRRVGGRVRLAQVRSRRARRARGAGRDGRGNHRRQDRGHAVRPYQGTMIATDDLRCMQVLTTARSAALIRTTARIGRGSVIRRWRHCAPTLRWRRAAVSSSRRSMSSRPSSGSRTRGARMTTDCD